jgi:uncharacterized protein YjbI with pentapeptide repeats
MRAGTGKQSRSIPIVILVALVLTLSVFLGILSASGSANAVSTAARLSPTSPQILSADRNVAGTTPSVSPSASQTDSTPLPTKAPTSSHWNAWESSVSQTPAGQDGCSAASYGGTQWQPSQCDFVASGPSAAAGGSSPSSVGNGNDMVANETSGEIGSVVGTFPVTDDLTSETGGHGIGPFVKANCAGGNLPNCYELQINTNVFWTSTSYTGGVYYPAWDQFLYGNPPGGGSGGVYIEVWVFNYYYVNGDTCPPTIPGFGSWFNSSANCTANGIGTPVPNIPATDLNQVTFSAYSNYKGSGNDVAEICLSGGSCYKFTMSDDVLDLYKHWDQAEFNVFGNEDGSGAYFNSGTSIEVDNNLTDGSGNPLPATCLNNGTTGESNNLFLQTCDGTSNGIVLTEASQAFTVSVTPSDVTVLRGQTASYDISLDLTGGTGLPVTLSVISGLPSGAIGTILSGSVTPTGSTTLFVSTSLGGPLGDFTFTVQAQFGVVIWTASANLHIYDFKVVMSDSTSTVLRGTTTVYPFTLVLLPGSSTTNVPSELLSVSGLPSDATYAFNQPSATPTFAGCSLMTIADCLEIIVTTNGPPTGSLGGYTFTVTATDPNPSGGSRSTTAVLDIFDFTVGIVPISETTLRGTSTSYALSLKLIAGSSTTGVPSMTISVAGLPSDAVYALSTTSLTPTLLGSPTSTLTVTTHGPPSGSLGNFPFTVTATDPDPSGGYRTGSPSLHIFDFTVTLSPSSETLVQGGSVSMTVKLTLVPGSTTVALPSIAMSIDGLPSGVITVGYPTSMTIGSTDTFILETAGVASYVNCPQVRNGGGQAFPGADLAHCDLAGYNLQGDDFQNANLEEANLADANLAGANLQSANLDSANTAGTDFQDAGMAAAQLTSEFPTGMFGLTAVGSVDGGSRTSGTSTVTVLGNQLSGDVFQGAYLPYADLYDDVAVATNFQGATLTGANLQDVDLQTADFQYAVLTYTDLEGATLTGTSSVATNFDDSDLEYANLTDAVCGAPNFIVAAGASVQNILDVPAPCNPPLGIALGASFVTDSLTPNGGEAVWMFLAIELGIVALVAGLIVARGGRPPRTGTTPIGHGSPLARAQSGHYSGIIGPRRAGATPTYRTKDPREVIRKARAARAALLANGDYRSAALLGNVADTLAGLAELPRKELKSNE